LVRFIRLALTSAALLIAPALHSADAPAWRIATADLPPFSVASGDDAPGALVEVTQALATRAGFSAEVEFLPWTRAQAESQLRPHTVVVPLTRIPEREDKYRWIVKLYRQQFVFIALRDKGVGVASPEALRHKRIAALRNSPSIVQLRQRGFSQIVEAENIADMVQMLRLNMVVAMFGSEAINLYALKHHGVPIGELVVSEPLAAGDIWLCGAPQTTDAEAAAWVQAMTQIRRDKTYARILARYGLRE